MPIENCIHQKLQSPCAGSGRALQLLHCLSRFLRSLKSLGGYSRTETKHRQNYLDILSECQQSQLILFCDAARRTPYVNNAFIPMAWKKRVAVTTNHRSGAIPKQSAGLVESRSLRAYGKTRSIAIPSGVKPLLNSNSFGVRGSLVIGRKESKKEMRVNLQVPFEEKDDAKRLGARWDVARKIWYVENVVDLEKFLKWIPDYYKKPHQQSLNDWFNGKPPVVAKNPKQTEIFSKPKKKQREKSLIEHSKPIRGKNFVETVCDCLPWIGCEKCRIKLTT